MRTQVRQQAATPLRSNTCGARARDDLVALVASRPEMVDSRTASEVLGIAPKTLINWRLAGRGPGYVKYGSRHVPVRYVVEELLHWRQAHTREATTGGNRRA